MKRTMEKMIREATAQMKANKVSYGFANEEIDGKTVQVYILDVNTNGRQMIQKRWKIDGVKVSAASVLAM